MSTALQTLTGNLAKQFNMGDGSDLTNTLKATAFKSGTQVSDAQMTALLVVANQYGLNPFTREIYAFPDKGGIVPVVGLDGWSRIINSHAQFDGMDFDQDADSCTCTIHRKDRSHPVRVTEWMAECKRNTVPWTSHPKRMLRHKAMIQCARLAFGFTGIYEQDEAERILEADKPRKINTETGEIEIVDDGYQAFEDQWLPVLREAAMGGWDSLKKALVSVPTGSLKDKLGIAHSKALKVAAKEADANVVDAEVV